MAWRKLWVAYNAVLLVEGVWILRDGFVGFPFIVGIAVAANVCFCPGPVVDALAARLLRRRLASVRYVVFASGLLLSIGLVHYWTTSLRTRTDWVRHAMAHAMALSEVRHADLACAKMLIDADCRSFFAFFNDLDPLLEAHGTYARLWNAAIPELLRHGKDAKLNLKPEVRRKIDASYLDLGEDPWGKPYQFFAGPLTVENCGTAAAAYYFRSYRSAAGGSYTDRNGQQQSEYYYDAHAAADAATEQRSAPNADGLPGYPAPTDLPLYIWSMGMDGKSCQRVGLDLSPKNVNVGPSRDSGDDVNSWDPWSGWCSFYD